MQKEETQVADPRTNEEVKDPAVKSNETSLEKMPIDMIMLIASQLQFRQFMVLLRATKKWSKLLDNNDLWRCQIQNFFRTSTYNAKPNCRQLFKHIYNNRKMFEPAILTGFKSAYISCKISSKSDNAQKASLKNILLDDTLFIYESDKEENVNIAMTTYNTTPYFIRSIKISGPKQTPRAPLSAGLVFLFNEDPDLTELDKFNSFTKQQWDELVSKYGDTESLRKAGCPVVYFEGLEEAEDRKLFINFDFPFPVASHIVLKMLRGKSNHLDRSCIPGSIGIANMILYGAAADARFSNITWKDNHEPDDIDMGGLSDYDEF